MIRGIGIFYRKTRTPLVIHFVEKGVHVEEAKALCAEEGISEFVTWHQEMTQKEVFEYYRDCDISFDQLGNHWVGAGGWDAMATGRPVIANGRPDVYKRLWGKPLPVCQATTAQEVADWLQRLAEDPNLRTEIGLECRKTVLDAFDVSRTANFYISALEQILGTRAQVRCSTGS